MKPAFLLLPLAAAILLSACETTHTEREGTAAAIAVQADDAPAAQRVSAGHGKRAFVETYDTDGDGKVTLAEFMAEREQGYRLRDADGDSAVHKEEYVSEYERRLEQELKDRHDRQIKQAYVRFDVLDTDKDGTITLTEFNASGSRMFLDLDTNGDGIVDQADTADAY
jgi:cytochrome c5